MSLGLAPRLIQRVGFSCLLLLGRLASHGVKSGSIVEPLELGLVEGVAQRNVVGSTVLGVDTESHRLADSHLSAEEIDSVGGLDLVVVGGVREGQRKHTLLLQVGFVLEGKTS